MTSTTPPEVFTISKLSALCSVPKCTRGNQGAGLCLPHTRYAWNGVCRVDDCHRPVAVLARGYCETHNRRFTRHGSLRLPQRPSVCVIDGCGKPPRAKGLCTTHYHRNYNYGSPLAEVGPAHNLVGRRTLIDKPSYTGVHSRLLSQRGLARTHSCVDCGSQALHWSLDGPGKWISQTGAPYTDDLEMYRPRCVSCHKLLDMALARSAS